MYKDKLKYLRNEKELSQADLAKVLNIHRGSYSKYETQDNIMPIKHLNFLANYFNVSLDYLFGFTHIKNYQNINENIDKAKVGERLKAFRKNLKNLTQDKLAKILNTEQQVIGRYEQGKNLIATPFLYDICKKYNISADFLLGKIDFIPDWCNKK